MGGSVSEFVPNGYISMREALNRLGRDLFTSEWTGEEHKARRGLISADEWLKIKDLPPARGSGAVGSPVGGGLAEPVTARVPDDPSSPAYQDEYRASKRYADARHQLRVRLEGGDLEAAIWDAFTGTLHPVPASLWRLHNADRMIEKGEAPIPGSLNTGGLLVKQFAEASVPAKPMSPAKMREAIEALKAKNATETLTRPQQEEFLRESFPGYHITVRQKNKIFQSVPVKPGRPKKSDNSV
jgi:hypothetical protein